MESDRQVEAHAKEHERLIYFLKVAHWNKFFFQLTKNGKKLHGNWTFMRIVTLTTLYQSQYRVDGQARI